MDGSHDEDTALLSMAEEMDIHTAALRQSVLASVRSVRGKIARQAQSVIEAERVRSQDTEQHLLGQISNLQRLVSDRTAERDTSVKSCDGLVKILQRVRCEKRRERIAQSPFRHWRGVVAWRKRRSELAESKASELENQHRRSVFHQWQIQMLRAREAKVLQSQEQSHRRTVAKMESANHASENAARLEVLALKEQLAKEEENRGLLEERLKAAFMRGVCSLNMEAMHVLRHTPKEHDTSVATMLQALNVSGVSGESRIAEPASVDRLVEQQRRLQAQLEDLQNR